MSFNARPLFNVSGQNMPKAIEFGFDLFLQNLGSGSSVPISDSRYDCFTILIDSPHSRRIDFIGNKGIFFESAGLGAPIRIGTYIESAVQHYTVTNYFEENRFEFRQDGRLIYSGRFHYPVGANPDSPESIDFYRLNLSDGTATLGQPVAVIDNVTIRSVPEPRTALLFVFAGLSTLVRRCRRNSSLR